MIHRVLTPILLRSGLVGSFRNSSWRRNRLAILCYHSLAGADEHVWDPALYMAPSRLEERFAFFQREGYNVLSLTEGMRRLTEGSLPERSLVLTFDDGTRDFANLVVPLLEKYGFPATVYLSTWYCGRPDPVFGVFAKYVLWKGRQQYGGGPLWQLGSGWDLHSMPGLDRLITAFRHKARELRLSSEDRLGVLEDLAQKLGVDYAAAWTQTNFHLMTPAQVQAVSRSPLVQVELHTHHHRTPLDRDLFQAEIRENRRRIEEMTGIRPHHFCYPSGVFDSNFLPWLQELDVHSATTGEGGLASQANHPLLLPRVVDTTNLSLDRLAIWVSGVGHFTRRRSRIGERARAV